MKSKFKKYIKRCTIFLTVFVICFSCFSFPSAALGDNSNGLYLDYFIKPHIEEYIPNVGWQTLSDYDSMSFTQSPDGSIDKLIYSWTGLYGIMKADTRYRVMFSFYLRGENWQQFSLSFNSYFSNAVNSQRVDSPSSFISLSASYTSTILQPSPSFTYNITPSRLGSRVGYNFLFPSFDELVSLAPSELNPAHFISSNSNFAFEFSISEDLTDISFVLDNFSSDLFFQAPSDDAFQDYDNAEQQILDSTAQGREEATSLFGGFGSLATYVSTPILAVGNIMGEFFSEIDILNTVLRFSLSLGIFSFLVGMTVSIGGYFSSKSAKAERKASNAERSAYYRAGTAYYKSRTKK